MPEIISLNLKEYKKIEPAPESETAIDSEFKTKGFWERRLPRRAKEKIVAGLMLGMTLLGPASSRAETKGDASHPETTISESAKERWVGAHQALFVRGKDGESHFNPWGLVFPGQLEFGSNEEKTEKLKFEIPYEYSRLFDTGKPLSEEDHQKIADYINQRLQEEFADKLYGFDKDVYRAHHGGVSSEHPKITSIAVTGAASPEGPYTKGPSSLEPGHVDNENLRLALKRAEVGMGLTEESLKDLGINLDQLEKAATMIGGKEIQFSDQEMVELTNLASNEEGADPLEKIFNLTVKYNNKEISDPEIVNALDQIIGSKRKVAVTVSYQGENKSTVLIPVPWLIFLPLLRLIKRREDNGGGDEEPIPTPPEKPTKQKLLTGLEIPPKFKEVSLPDPNSPEYQNMEEQTILNDLYSNFDNPTAIERGLSYQNIADNLYGQYEEFPDDSGREDFLAAKILMGWKDHDRMARRDAGIEGEEIDRGLDYENQNNQILWAKMHARKLLEIIKQRKELEAGGTKQGYTILLTNEFTKLLKRREIRMNGDNESPAEAEQKIVGEGEEIKPVTPEPESVSSATPIPEATPDTMSAPKESVAVPPVAEQEAPVNPETKSFNEILILREEAFLAWKEMNAFRHGKKVADLTPEQQIRYKELKEISLVKRKAWLAALDKLPEDQQDELKDLTNPQEVQEHLATMTPEQVVANALEGTLDSYKDELATLEAEIQEMERLIRYDKDTVRGVTALGNEDDLKALKSRRKALVAKIASMSVDQVQPQDDLAGEARITPEPAVPTPEPEIVPTFPPVVAETAPRPILDYEQDRAEAKARRLELLRASMNAVDRKMMETAVAYSEAQGWKNVMERMRISERMRALVKERQRLDREMNERQGFGTKFKETVAKAYRSVKSRLKFERSRPVGIGDLRGGPEPVPPIGESTGPEIEDETLEPVDTKGTWGKWIKQRVGGFFTVGIAEGLTAERYRRETKDVSKDLGSMSRVVETERDLSREDAHEEANRIMAKVRAEGGESASESRFLEISTEITEQRIARNNAKIDEIVLAQMDQLEQKLKGYKGDFGQNVLTEENKGKIATEMRARLVMMRSGEAEFDMKSMTTELRKGLDSKWWRRYVYAGVDAVLWGLLIQWVGGHFLAGKTIEAIAAKGGAITAKEVAPQVLEKHLTNMAIKNFATQGILNPTQIQINQVVTAMAQENGVAVVSAKTGALLWPATAGGILKDIALAKEMLIEMGAASKVIATIKAGMVAGAL